MPKLLRGDSIKSVVEAMSSLAFIAACGAIVWLVVFGRVPTTSPARPAPAAAKARPEPPLPAEPVSLEGAILAGDAKAKVGVIEYSEFQCPFCARFASDTQPALKKKYVDSGKVLWAFRHFPLEKIHPNAIRAGMAAECADKQGRFWQLHEVLFRNQKQLDAASLTTYARSIGVNSESFDACMRTAAESEVRADMALAQKFAVTGTPTFFIGLVQPNGTVRVTRRFSGALPVASFETEIDYQLAAKVAAK